MSEFLTRRKEQIFSEQGKNILLESLMHLTFQLDEGTRKDFIERFDFSVDQVANVMEPSPDFKNDGGLSEQIRDYSWWKIVADVLYNHIQDMDQLSEAQKKEIVNVIFITACNQYVEGFQNQPGTHFLTDVDKTQFKGFEFPIKLGVDVDDDRMP